MSKRGSQCITKRDAQMSHGDLNFAEMTVFGSRIKTLFNSGAIPKVMSQSLCEKFMFTQR